MAWHADHLFGELDQCAPQMGSVRSSPASVAFAFRPCWCPSRPTQFAGERRGDVLAEAHRLAHLADGGPGAVVDDGGAKAGAVAAVFGVDVLDHLFASLMFEIDIDIGGFVAVEADETFEKEIVRGGVDRGDAEDEADGGVGGRPRPWQRMPSERA